MDFIDCDCMLGSPAKPLEHGIDPGQADLLREMGRLRIMKSLVRHRVCVEYNPVSGNRALSDELSPDERLLAVEMVSPDGEHPGFDPEAVVARLADNGRRVVWMHPSAGDAPYPFRPWCVGRLLSALQERSMPVLIQYDSVSVDDIHETLKDFPLLPIILLNIPRLGRYHAIWELARQHTRLYLCISSSFTVLDGISSLCRLIGAERLVWGSGYPEREGGASVTNLTYSGISSEEQELIAHTTIEGLLGKACHG